MKRYLWILTLATAGVAQQAAVELTTPTLGYIFDEQARTLRAIEGVPGSAAIGNPLHLGAGLDFIAVAPSRSYAFGYENGGDALVVVRLDGNAGARRNSTLPRARAWFSASGEVAAFDLGERTEVWGGLPDDPRRMGEFSTGGRTAEKLLVSDDGGMVAMLAGGELYRLSADSAERLGQGIRDAAFLRGTRDLFALEAGRLIRFLKAEPDAEETVLAGLDDASAFAISRDQKQVAVAGADVMVADLRTGQAARVQVDETRFDAVVRAEGDAVFQLHAVNGETWLLDADSAPRLQSLAARGNQ